MIVKDLLSGRKKKAGYTLDPSSIPEKYIINKKLPSLESAVENAAAMLGLTAPQVVFLPYLYLGDTLCITSDMDPDRPREDHIDGFYDVIRNTIFLSTFDTEHERVYGKRKRYSAKILTLHALHELRHAYQRKYYDDIFFPRSHLSGMRRTLHDAAEVDADAFAISYHFNVSDGTQEDLESSWMRSVSEDKGSRAKRVHEICARFGWDKILITPNYIPTEAVPYLSFAQIDKIKSPAKKRREKQR